METLWTAGLLILASPSFGYYGYLESELALFLSVRLLNNRQLNFLKYIFRIGKLEICLLLVFLFHFVAQCYFYCGN